MQSDHELNPRGCRNCYLDEPSCSYGEKAAGILLGKRKGLVSPSFIHRQDLNVWRELLFRRHSLVWSRGNLLWCPHPAGLSKTRHKWLVWKHNHLQGVELQFNFGVLGCFGGFLWVFCLGFFFPLFIFFFFFFPLLANVQALGEILL